MSSVYERELRDIFQGDITPYIKTVDDACIKGYLQAYFKPFSVIRGAGSLGIDILPMRGDQYYPIEVKSSKKGSVYFSSDERLQEQLDNFTAESERTNVPVAYALRNKGVPGEKWQMFRIDTEISKSVYWMLPAIPRSKDGSPILKWGDGFSLSAFISKVLGNTISKIMLGGNTYYANADRPFSADTFRAVLLQDNQLSEVMDDEYKLSLLIHRYKSNLRWCDL